MSHRAAAPAPRQASWRQRVLIVEDDDELWPVIERYSTRAQPGMQLEFASSTEEAEARLASDAHYDVVVTDYCLPEEGGGSQVARCADTHQPWARVGMISSHPDFEPRGTPFLPKPFTPDGYRRFLRELLGRGNANDAI